MTRDPMRTVFAVVTTRVLRGPSIGLALCSYRRGTRFTCEMTLEQAEALRDQLDEAIELTKAEPY